MNSTASKITIWDFKSALLHAHVESDGAVLKSRFTDADGQAIGDLLLPYRLLSHNGWHGEAREMPHRLIPDHTGYKIEWPESIGHGVRLSMQVEASGEGQFDVQIRAEVLTKICAYELFQSWYFARGYQGGAYVVPMKDEIPSAPGLLQVQPQDIDIYREMYISFPRDERAAEMICDGRWQRGRHFTRFLPCRYYAVPMGFYSHHSSDIGILMMGRPQDVFAVNLAYHSDNPKSSVGQHNSFYLSLLGRDVHPGETIETGYRMLIGKFGSNPAAHFEAWNAYLNDQGQIGG